MTATETVADLAARVAAQARDCPRRFVLGITGPPGAGKSTVAERLRTALRDLGQRAEVAPMDGFHLTNSALDRAGRRDRKGAPDTFDVAGYCDRLRALRDRPLGQPVPWPGYDRVRHEPVPGAVLFDRQTIVITEGNYLLLDDPVTGWSAVRELLDAAWYLDVPDHLLTDRLSDRHRRGGKSPELAARLVAGNDLPNAALVRDTERRADLVLTPAPDSAARWVVRAGASR
jgi:pantothenate kinase